MDQRQQGRKKWRTKKDGQEEVDSPQRAIEHEEEITELRGDQDLGLWSQKVNEKENV